MFQVPGFKLAMNEFRTVKLAYKDFSLAFCGSSPWSEKPGFGSSGFRKRMVLQRFSYSAPSERHAQGPD